MPMAINSLEEYEKVLNVSWFTPDKTPEELTSVLHIAVVS
jgi:exocyst complex component 6